MLRRFVTAGLLAGALVLGSGCFGGPFAPPVGTLYTEIGAPTSLGSGQLAARRGESSVVAILGIGSSGQASVEAAADEGGITRVKRVEYRYENVLLGLYQRYTTIVWGD